MVAAGVSESVLFMAKHRQSNGWSFIDDPADNRKVLIEFDTLKDRYKQAVTNHFGDPHTYIRQSALKALLEKDPKALDFYRDKNLLNGKGLPDNAILSYTKAAQWLNMLIRFNALDPKRTLKGLGMSSRREFYDACVAIIRAESIDLPANYCRLMEKLRTYEQDGYAALISKKYGNANSQKISAEAGEWLCAYYGDFRKPTVEQAWMAYNSTAQGMGWPQLDHHNTVYQYLHRPDVIQRWYGLREGWDKEKERYGIQAKNLRTSMRDGLWWADGTGFNFAASDSKMQRVYWVQDDYSEVILGWDIEKTECEKSVYRAFRAAVQFAGQKPYEIRYDQGSSNLKIGPFLDNIAAKLHFGCEAYNGKSKGIESVTGRFQAQVMREWFFFTGQNRGGRSDRGKLNLTAHQEIRSLLPDFATLVLIFAECVKQWNNAKHPKHNCTRLELYLASQNPQAVPFTMMDAVDMFWNTAPRPIAYRAEGLPMEVGGKKYLFEVYDADGQIDIKFRKQWIGEKFIVRYDPDDMTQAWLYLDKLQGPQFVAAADNVDTHRFHIATQDLVPGEKKKVRELQELRRTDNKQRQTEAREMAERHEKLPKQIAKKQLKKIESLTLAEVYREDDNWGPPVTLYGPNTMVDEMENAE